MMSEQIFLSRLGFAYPESEDLGIDWIACEVGERDAETTELKISLDREPHGIPAYYEIDGRNGPVMIQIEAIYEALLAPPMPMDQTWRGRYIVNSMAEIRTK